MSLFVAVDVLGDRLDLVLGEAAERVLHHLHVAVEVAGALLVGELGEELGGAVGADERQRIGEGVGLDAPLVLTTEDADGDVVDGVGDEGAGDAGLDVALPAVVEDGAGVLDGGGGVGQVVDRGLVGVLVGGREVAGGGFDDALGDVDGGGGSGEVRSGGGHGGEATERRFGSSHPDQWRRATTVTSGGSTTGSSPGWTSVRTAR